MRAVRAVVANPPPPTRDGTRGRHRCRLGQYSGPPPALDELVHALLLGPEAAAIAGLGGGNLPGPPPAARGLVVPVQVGRPVLHAGRRLCRGGGSGVTSG